ncbi:MAG: alpha/beta hydrolase [Pseudomonadota bacterium]
METHLSLHHCAEGESVSLALRKAAPAQDTGKPGFVWLGGFRSDMKGTKAQAMVEEAAALGCASLRFDYSGHGESGGVFEEGTISRWLAEALAVLEAHTQGPQILVGSSMGGWIALRVVEEMQKRGQAAQIAGLLLIAPAPDFTQKLMEPAFSDEQRAEMAARGFIEEPTPYSDEPNIITAKLIEDGRNNCVMDKNLALGVPVHILQGTDDPDVPMVRAQALAQALPHDDVVLTLVKGGDHRLSRDEDIALLRRSMGQVLERTLRN